jgi:hypothetical protein
MVRIRQASGVRRQALENLWGFASRLTAPRVVLHSLLLTVFLINPSPFTPHSSLVLAADWIEASIVGTSEKPPEIVLMRSELKETFPVADEVRILGPDGRSLPALPVPSWCRILLDRGKVVQINVIRIK